MRQYVILYKRLGMQQAVPLEPLVHAGLYGRAEVVAAIEHMRNHEHVEGMAIHLGDEQFQLFSFNHEVLKPNAFQFAPEEPAEFVQLSDQELST